MPALIRTGCPAGMWRKHGWSISSRLNSWPLRRGSARCQAALHALLGRNGGTTVYATAEERLRPGAGARDRPSPESSRGPSGYRSASGRRVASMARRKSERRSTATHAEPTCAPPVPGRRRCAAGVPGRAPACASLARLLRLGLNANRSNRGRSRASRRVRRHFSIVLVTIGVVVAGWFVFSSDEVRFEEHAATPREAEVQPVGREEPPRSAGSRRSLGRSGGGAPAQRNRWR